VTALREGAFDYVTKPFDCEEFTLRVIGRIAERRALRAELEQARAQLVAREVGALVVGTSPPMVRLAASMDTIAQGDAHVLITGEPGTGKELVARTIHARSARRALPFVLVRCSAFTDDALEAELFGSVLSTGHRREGKIHAARGGTLFLDDVESMPRKTQSRLLQVLNDASHGVVAGAGAGEGAAGEAIDVRVMAATETNLRALAEAGKFMPDLLSRIDVLELALPPLRERRGDLPLLLQYFLRRLTPLGKVPPGIAPRAWAAISEYPFPGIVREFSHAIERALVVAHGSEIDLEHLPPEITRAHTSTADVVRPLSVAMKEYERQYLLRVLHLAGGKRGRAAGMLGISRKNLWEKLRLHGISAPEADD
jgi:DNA-binding NtrC family response regulator